MEGRFRKFNIGKATWFDLKTLAFLKLLRISLFKTGFKISDNTFCPRPPPHPHRPRRGPRRVKAGTQF